MKLGIDLGTTRTIVAAHDRGNYPVVGFYTDDGDLIEHYPTCTAEVGGELVHGLAAEAAERAGAPSLRSWKRQLSVLGPTDLVRVGDVELTISELCADYLRALRRDLVERSNLTAMLKKPEKDESHKKKKKNGAKAPTPKAPDLERISAAVSVPANAHSTQRFVTLEGFRAAGFEVCAVLNEPSAAGIEFAHRHKSTVTSRREHVIVYDLGGGTFDAALVRIADGRHDVVSTSGVARLGGDDFDEALLELALERARFDGWLAEPLRRALMLECRFAKESLNPNTKKLVLDFSEVPGVADEVVVPVADYYDRVRPLVERTLDALAPVLEDAARDGDTDALGGDGVAGIYMVGGASGLPAVPRVVREHFGRRVHRSPHPSAATAIGLAITAAAGADAPSVRETFTRHFGVFREAEGGERVTFDGIFEKGTPMPRDGGHLTTTRRYRAAHNVGHFRFVESGALDAAGDPTGDITPHGDVRFPFVADEPDAEQLSGMPIERLAAEGPWVEERYEVDEAGVIAVTITDLDRGRHARFVL